MFGFGKKQKPSASDLLEMAKAPHGGVPLTPETEALLSEKLGETIKTTAHFVVHKGGMELRTSPDRAPVIHSMFIAAFSGATQRAKAARLIPPPDAESEKNEKAFYLLLCATVDTVEAWIARKSTMTSDDVDRDLGGIVEAYGNEVAKAGLLPDGYKMPEGVTLH